MIKFYCPNCKQKLGVPDEYAGRRIRCNKCNQPAVVPKPAPTAVVQPNSNPNRVAATDQREVDGKKTTVSAVTPRPAAPALKPQPPAQPKPPADELDLIVEEEIPAADPNLEAIRQAAHDRFSHMKTPSGAAKKSSSASHAKSSVAAGVAKGMGKIPLSLAACFGCMAAVIVIWVILAKITGLVFGLVVTFVPVAGAWGLTRFTEHRGIMLGLLAAFLGFVGMTIGHIAVAKYVVMPMLEEDSTVSETINEAFNEGLGGNSSLVDEEMVGQIAGDDEEMFYIAAMSLVGEGKMDREIIRQIMRQDFQSMMSEDQQQEQETPEDAAPAPQTDLTESYSQIDSRLLSWNDTQRKQAVRKNYTELTKLRSEFLFKDTGFGAAVTFIAAFVGSFSFWDLLWYPMGLFGAFKLAAALDGEE